MLSSAVWGLQWLPIEIALFVVRCSFGFLFLLLMDGRILKMNDGCDLQSGAPIAVNDLLDDHSILDAFEC